jgi:nitroimidazol reductase NimA-like FMN-containing flavoprotein (pyridoxamine 5'-phosphate oxidase superfamily)
MTADPTPDAASDPDVGLEVRRKRDRQSHDPAVLAQILAEGMVAHVGMVRGGAPIVLPYLYAVGDLGDGLGRRMLLHGSTGGGLFLDAGADGIPISATVTHIDGLVFARSLNDSSANYRSAMVYGRATVVPAELRMRALWIVGDHLMPGRRTEVREITAKELAATQVLQLPLERVSVKVRAANVLGEGPDDGEDHGVWAGVLPLAVTAGEPIVSEQTDAVAPVPASVTALAAALVARGADRAEHLRGRTVVPAL